MTAQLESFEGEWVTDSPLPVPVLDWQDRGLCAQTDPELFFPEKGGSTREAKRVCLSCDVRVECLEYALTNGERFGIWGGLSERERRRTMRTAVSALPAARELPRPAPKRVVMSTRSPEALARARATKKARAAADRTPQTAPPVTSDERAA